MPFGVSTSTVRRYLWPGRLMRIWSPTTSTANSASGPTHLFMPPALPATPRARLPRRPCQRQTGADADILCACALPGLIPRRFGETVRPEPDLEPESHASAV